MTQKENNTKPFRMYLIHKLAIQLAVLIGKVLPRNAGLKLASWIGTLLGSLKNHPMVKAIRANQWVIQGQSLTEEELQELPKIVFRSAAKCMFDFFYYLPRPDEMQQVVDFSPEADAVIERIKNDQPTVVVCPHLSNFDLMGYALTLNDIEVQVLSHPKPSTSYKLQNEIRESLGLIITPLSLKAFRQARERLENGGSILTGLDRPLDAEQHDKYQPTFFGYKTNLPVTYVRMAKEANAPIIVLAATSQDQGRYSLEASGLIWMESADDLETEILNNANRVLNEAEGLIKKYAHQWAMFYAVWPQFLGV